MDQGARRTSDETRRRGREKTRAYRERMRAKGMRQITMWVRDTREPEFAALAQRESRAIARSRHEAEDQAFIDAVSELTFE